jgi:hypothetical protein
MLVRVGGRLRISEELRKQERGGDGMRIVERIPAHYQVEEVEDFGRSYRWYPEQVVLECNACGTRTTHKRSNLTTSIIACECKAKSTADIREQLLREVPIEDEVTHPWRYWQPKVGAGIPV